MTEKKSTYNKEVQKKYNDKCKKYTVKFTLNEIDIAEKVEKAIEQSGLTANSYIKMILKKELEKQE